MWSIPNNTAERTDTVDRAGITVLRIIQSPLPARQLIRALAEKNDAR
jgi:hypothetical protein